MSSPEFMFRVLPIAADSIITSIHSVTFSRYPCVQLQTNRVFRKQRRNKVDAKIQQEISGTWI